MTDPNKAAVTESNAEFLNTIARADPEKVGGGHITITLKQYAHLRKLAEERVMIEEHRMGVHRFHGKWEISTVYEDQAAQSTDLSTALRNVVQRITEVKDAPR